MKSLDQGLAAGYARLAARSALLDRINVFPVADGDTGTNLRISLAPIRTGSNGGSAAAQLQRTATGNSGNIAAAFFAEFLQADMPKKLAHRAAGGAQRARRAVAQPRQGTMLDVFDRVADLLALPSTDLHACIELLKELRQVVLASTLALPELRAAGVVDAGALGMYLFFDGFFRGLAGYVDDDVALSEHFPHVLALSDEFCPAVTSAHCVDALLKPEKEASFAMEEVAALGESVVMVPSQDGVKVHIHTDDPASLRQKMGDYGEILSWSDEAMAPGGEVDSPARKLPAGSLHIMTDAAGSLSRTLADRHGISLLDSYIVIGDAALPESHCQPEDIYCRMRRGEKVTTAQASLIERHQSYRAACEEFGPTLYLTVGSAFTGNFATARAWQEAHDEAGLFTVIDTGAASGRLAVIALLAARYNAKNDGADTLDRVRVLLDCCREYIFIDVLRYLVAGGRVSRSGGFFGDLLHMKPVISPTSAGVARVGMVRNHHGQLDFAEKRLRLDAADWQKPLVLLQYSDNKQWVVDVVRPWLEAISPRAEIVIQPLSLTSGVHMGPGTWSIAFGPEL